jgi:pentafunctional AROM polypeptide
MHNAAFHAAGLDAAFHYGLHDTSDVQELVARMRAPHTAFGGGSVTIPLKVDIMPFLDELSPAARAIGAVNTVIREDVGAPGDVRWRGDNTDWLGILRPIRKRLAGRKGSSELRALVVGAGGTSMAAAYAMQQLGVRELFVYNRTLSKAQEVAARFDAVALEALTSEALAHVDVVVSTIPATAGFTLPDHLVTRELVVLDAAYMPPVTPMLAHAHARGATCIQGFEMLVEQAVEQFLRWHRASLAAQVDDDVLRQACLQRVPAEMRLA